MVVVVVVVEGGGARGSRLVTSKGADAGGWRGTRRLLRHRKWLRAHPCCLGLPRRRPAAWRDSSESSELPS